MTTRNGRTADHPIDAMFLERWSPRAFTSESLPPADLMTMLEAARWAASSYNMQPWRFLYALRDTAHWERFLDLLVPFNRGWAQHAAALVFFVSRNVMRRPGTEVDAPSPTHAYDTGTASGYFTLQASRMGWAAHGMIGFDRDRAVAALGIPPDFSVDAVYAVGRLGDPNSLPEGIRAREQPSGREPLDRLAFEGGFPDVDRRS